MPRRVPRPPTRRQALAAGVASAVTLSSPRLRAEPTAWVDLRQVGPFVLRAAFPLASAGLDLDGLTRLESELRRVLALKPCREPIEVLLLPDEATHRRVVAERHPTAPYRRALFVRVGRRSTVFAYRHDDLATDLRHECTHALLHADLPMVPLWLDEGIAEYFEAPTADRPRGPAHLRALRWDLRLGRLTTVAQLEAKLELAELDATDYRFAWAWTHFMLHGPERVTTELWAYLATLRRGEPPGDLSRRLDAVDPRLNARFAAHFREWPAVLRRARSA